MKKGILVGALVAAGVLACTRQAHAESFFQIEAGSGLAIGQTLNDGVWYQQGNPQSHLRNLTPAYLLGVTGEMYRLDKVDFRYHIDYVYMGSQSASCQCVSDDDYNAKTNKIITPGAPTTGFSGGGHIQGIAATLDVGYNYGPWRFGAEGGPWIFWETWHEAAQTGPTGPWMNVPHKTVAQLSYTAGLNVSYKNSTLSYRYYNLPQKWNPYPALLRATHMVAFTYRF